MNFDKLLGSILVRPGRNISLAKDFDPAYHDGVTKEQAQKLLPEGVARLADEQDKLYAQDRHAVLIVIQAMDAAGKDSTIKHVMSGLNPQGTEVYSFKGPSEEELDHDYLWRCARAMPRRGRIGIFNRSYYEEVLVVRVHPEILAGQRIPEPLLKGDIWKRRFDEINNFEKYLCDNGTSIIKFFLNVSRDEQRKRFLDRIDQPEKNWKFSAADVRERDFWPKYQAAYQDMLRHTSTAHAPWYVIPADHKWFTRIAVAETIAARLKELKLAYPKVSPEHHKALLEAKKKLKAEGS